MPKLILFHCGSTYEYHFIIKELAEELEGRLNVFRRKRREEENLSSANFKKIINLKFLSNISFTAVYTFIKLKL